MVAFIIRRIFGMILVLTAVSFIVYLIFIVIPGGDPADRIAGQVATPANIASIKHMLGLDHNFIIQWLDMVKSLPSGTRVSDYAGTNRVQQIKEGTPVPFSRGVGAGIIWLGFGAL